MTFSLVRAFALLFALLCSLANLVEAGRAEVVHQCKYPVWCAVVAGYAPNDPTPQNQRPPVVWVPQPAGKVIVDQFNTHPVDTGMALMCTRDPSAEKPAVTQLEYTWRPDQSMTYFDVSNVEGNPFGDEGFRMDVYDPIQPLPTYCYPAVCAPGDQACGQIYNKWDDDFQGMRACSHEMAMRLNLCSG